MNSVEIKKLDLHFGSVEVLNDLNLEIEKGEFLVLLGSSGCGKSTLLNCIAGLLEITNGQIFIEGKNVTWSEPSERGIGMVFQSYALYPQMTVEGNLSFGLKNAKLPKVEIQKRVTRAAEILQIEPLLKRKPSALSGGQRQRVAMGLSRGSKTDGAARWRMAFCSGVVLKCQHRVKANASTHDRKERACLTNPLR